MSQILNLFLLSMFLSGAFPCPRKTSPQVQLGRCRGGPINYLESVPSLQDCFDACNSDERCWHFSYHRSDASQPNHEVCLLFSAGQCDLENLMDSEALPQWVSGGRTVVPSRCPRFGNQITLVRDGRSQEYE